MNCPEAKGLLSAYFDHELPAKLGSQMAEHLESCPDCANEIAAYERMSTLTQNLSQPEPPAEIWTRLESQMDEDSAVGQVVPVRNSRRVIPRQVVIAALVFLSIGLIAFAYQTWFGPETHNEMAVNFSRYLEAFQRDPSDAQLVLVNKYEGVPVKLEDAAQHLGYRPVVADGLPDGYSLQSAYVLNMPCCKCVQCVFTRSDGKTIVIFEHEDEQRVWFGDRPSVSALCGGKPCSITQMDSQIAASWKIENRQVTVIGADDTDEVTRLVEHLGKA